jgi:hypothetical protein
VIVKKKKKEHHKKLTHDGGIQVILIDLETTTKKRCIKTILGAILERLVLANIFFTLFE